MGGQVMNLAVIIAVGVILADLVKNGGNTVNILNGFASIWKTGVNGMLGSTS